jgi:hypothetical protein
MKNDFTNFKLRYILLDSFFIIIALIFFTGIVLSLISLVFFLKNIPFTSIELLIQSQTFTIAVGIIFYYY